MSVLPLTDGIYMGENLLVPPMPPVPATSAPWIQFNSNGQISATNLSELRNASGVFSKSNTGAASLNISLPDATNINSAFSGNAALQELELISTSDALLSVIALATGSNKLKKVRVELPNLVGEFGNFNGCTSLESAVIILPKCTSLSFYCLRYCLNLTEVQLIAPQIVTAPYLCINCTNLSQFSGEYPELVSCISGFEATNLQQFDVVWPKISDLAGCFRNTALQAEEINKILQSLPSYSSGTHIITFTGSPGASSCDPTIGTAKGWTVQV